MSRDCYDMIERFLHFSQKSEHIKNSSTDKLFRIRSIIQKMSSN